MRGIKDSGGDDGRDHAESEGTAELASVRNTPAPSPRTWSVRSAVALMVSPTS
jgi:hypothetical protein